jgi:hypothetical protein
MLQPGTGLGKAQSSHSENADARRVIDHDDGHGDRPKDQSAEPAQCLDPGTIGTGASPGGLPGDDPTHPGFPGRVG